MSKNNSISLSVAKFNKKDEFYTQYEDIEQEMLAYLKYDENIFTGKNILLPCDNPQESNFTKFFECNFKQLGISKLISTCYKHDGNGKILIMERGERKKQSDLMGNGDFRSKEITKLRDSVDFVITNPPFSLFREFVAWIIAGNVRFSILGNLNAISCKNIFPLFQENNLWLGATISSGDREFKVPKDYPLEAAGYRIDDNGEKYIKVKGIRWFTNINHSNRSKTLELDTIQNNLSKTPKLIEKNAYRPYDNFLAIEIPKTQAIPSDYNGVMGVPISFLDKYNPKQFKILGIDFYVKDGRLNNLIVDKWNGKLDRAYLNNKRLYSRIFIEHAKECEC
ncbi:hypothetical protein BA920_03895 [Helicobacter pullorum]|uniref:adenine-specific methyltransferase EcoRI family protein n=1 Tax=Helicobacter pullorum TaxID=35818 RepID=UPI0008168F9E|nr:adenine-specific methyltransferase EcoRI family protein [Helicobacter pullorum]OCR05870.1 hypothetical protein BA920_03895 [Helicobacter pullorum]